MSAINKRELLEYALGGINEQINRLVGLKDIIQSSLSDDNLDIHKPRKKAEKSQVPKKRRLTTEARAKIVAAQRRRWAREREREREQKEGSL